MIAIYILGFVSLLLFALVLFLILKKERKEIPKNTLTLEISETFRKTIEGLIGEEVRRNLLLLRGEIEREQKKITDEYKRVFEELSKELRQQKDEVKNQTLIFSQKLKEKINEIEKITQETQNKILAKAKERGEQLNKNLEQIFAQSQNQFLKEMERKSEVLAKNLEGGFSEILKKFQEELKKEMERSKIEIENYKKEKIKEINKKFYSVLSEITKEVLGKTIDLTIHERLVMTALEKAKKKLSF